jgi:secreted trypsin-like serine protease
VLAVALVGVLAVLMFAVAVASAAAATGTGAAAPPARAAVVGGQDAAAGAYPWMVALSTGCGGSLIAPDRVLTAGHCVEDARASGLRVFVGAQTRAPGGYDFDGLTVRVADVATHPRYRSLEAGGPVFDAAVLRLAEPVTTVAPVPLAAPGDAAAAAVAAGAEATVVGWGITRTQLRGAPLATRLQEGRLRVLSDASCDEVFGRDASYRRSVMLCAGTRNRFRRPATSPCLGDSGGPLVAGAAQVGIVSFGISCGGLREPTVFARVSALRDFTDAPEPVWTPQPLGRAHVTGTLEPGRTATCVSPRWRGQVDRIRYRWGIDGRLVATGRRVRITAAARGRVLQCRAVAENAGGRTRSGASPAQRIAAG